MTVINIDNFNDKFPEIERSIQNAKFIGVDLEFSGLYPVKTHSPSLFDSPNERYKKLRINLVQVIPIQIGLTTFTFDPNNSTYHANIYNFYVLPASFPCVERSFYFQSDTLGFLRVHGFDFNEWVYSAIPFINTEQEDLLRRKLRNDEITEMDSNSRKEIENILETQGDLVKKWYLSAKEGDRLSLPKIYDNYKADFDILYFTQKHFRSNFKNVWTDIENGGFFVKKVSEEEYRTLERRRNLDEELITTLLGFTRVFRLLTKHQKPIVGHNLLQDILLLVSSFETSLPPSYTEFKKLAAALFPHIFDTKCISYGMRSSVPETKRWDDSSLESLFEYFKNGIGRHVALNSPAIILESDSNYGKFHEAGWDSFCAGYIFVRLAYLNVYEKYPKSKSFVSSELIAGLAEWKNYVNVIRGTVSSIKIDGEDPDSTRPPYLIIESVKNRPVDIPQITSLLSSFGFVEVRKFAYQNRRALIAVDNFGNARRILNNFKSNGEFQVKHYSALKHSSVLRAFILSGVTLSGAILLWLSHNAIKR